MTRRIPRSESLTVEFKSDRRQDVIELCRIGSDQAKRRLLARLVDEGVLTREGTGRSMRFVSGDRT